MKFIKGQETPVHVGITETVVQGDVLITMGGTPDGDSVQIQWAVQDAEALVEAFRFFISQQSG